MWEVVAVASAANQSTQVVPAVEVPPRLGCSSSGRVIRVVGMEAGSLRTREVTCPVCRSNIRVMDMVVVEGLSGMRRIEAEHLHRVAFSFVSFLQHRLEGMWVGMYDCKYLQTALGKRTLRL